MKLLIKIGFVLALSSASAQNVDTVNSKRMSVIVGANAIFHVGAYSALNQLWYSQYEQSNLHWFNDGREWMGVDKLGHAFTSYQLSLLWHYQFRYAGLNQTKSALWSAGLAWAGVSMIELFDARSAAWGASPFDLISNTLGVGLFVSQQLTWKEQRIKMKYSFHTTAFAKQRPDVLGDNLLSQALKDYNGQTYWLSINLKTMTGFEFMPAWLNLAVGYGADGMIEGERKNNFTNVRYPQFYLSPDIDLSKIKTRKKWFRGMLGILNMFKFPAPSIEFRNGTVVGHWF